MEKTATARERKCRIATSSNVPSTGLGSLGESGAIAPKLARVTMTDYNDHNISKAGNWGLSRDTVYI